MPCVLAFFVVMLGDVKLSVGAECHYADCHYSECHYADCRYALYSECRYALYSECRYAECLYA